MHKQRLRPHPGSVDLLMRFFGVLPGDLAEAQEDPQASQHPLFWRKVAEGYKNIRQDSTHGIPRRCSLLVLMVSAKAGDKVP
jgi:hypothetical protein